MYDWMQRKCVFLEYLQELMHVDAVKWRWFLLWTNTVSDFDGYLLFHCGWVRNAELFIV